MPKAPQVIEPISDATFGELVNAVAPKATPIHVDQTKETSDEVFETVEYSAPGEIEPIAFRFDGNNESIWATQAQIAELFSVDRSVITKHLKNIFSEGELDENSVCAKYAHTASDGKTYQTAHYSIDAIISVGYRVNSSRATKFRQWATRTIRAYVEQGYVINEKVLRESPEKLNKLAATIRALRSEEKQVYAKVRECFKISSSDYDKNAKEVRTFYALLQDKFLHAVTEQTASKLVIDRADHLESHMGVQHFQGLEPSQKEAETGKNYLTNEELYRLHILSEQFLLYAESRALANQKMTMASLHEQLDRLLVLNDYPVFGGYVDYLRDQALDHARREMTLYKKRKKIEELGYEYDEEALAAGEYDDILIEN